MKIGDVVVPTQESKFNGKHFHCGSGVYSHAVVGSIEPFILVSSSGDMVWSCTWEPHEVVSLCQASEEIQGVVRKRLEDDARRQRLKDMIEMDVMFGPQVNT